MAGPTGEKSESGFTLIELLIVIVVLGILAAIVVFAVGGVTDRGRAAVCKSDVKSVEVAEEAYRANTGTYTAIANLKTANLLRDEPNSPHYTITVDTSTGVVTATPPCASL